VAGYRDFGNGSIFDVGTFGYYWSSTLSGTFSRYLYFNSSAAGVTDDRRARGVSVRCLKDAAAAPQYPAGTVNCAAGATAVVDVTNPTTGQIWMDRNLGATQVATSSTDVNSYGDLYQWGRRADGHQCRTSPTTTTLSSIDQPAHGNFILAPSAPYDWRSPQNTNLWQGVNGVNNPCPSGYRLPTETELNAERLSWSQNNSAGAFASPLKLPVAGDRLVSNGSIISVGSNGNYWSGTVSGTSSRGLHLGGTALMYDSYRAAGLTVRCIKDAAAAPQFPAGTVNCAAGATAVVDVTNPTTGQIWMDRNLGASQVATSSTDVNSYGDLYQWGRRADGHQCRTSPTTLTLSSIDQPAHGDFILPPSAPYDWRSPQNVNLWQGVNGVNNPCPSGYRIPTETEINAERLSWSQNNSAGAFASPLKLPMAGMRSHNNGSLSSVGGNGSYWSSTLSGTSSRMLGSNSASAGMNDQLRAVGFSVRCLKD
jgi:uncharacterized protein (TIGR02145 family)